MRRYRCAQADRHLFAGVCVTYSIGVESLYDLYSNTVYDIFIIAPWMAIYLLHITHINVYIIYVGTYIVACALPCIICTMYAHVYMLHIANTGTTHLHLHMYNGM